MRSPVSRRDGYAFRRAHDVDAAVRAVLDRQDRIAGDEAVLDDPVEIAADEFPGSARTHPRRHPKLTAGGPRGYADAQSIRIATGERDLGEVKLRHA